MCYGKSYRLSVESWASRHRLTCMALLTIAAVGLSWSPSAHADLIATDHFLFGDPANPALGQYEATYLRGSSSSGGGQSPTVAGFTGEWSGNVFSGSGAVAQWKVADSSITSTLVYVDGGRARFSGVENHQRRVQRALSPYTAANTYYMSFLVQAALGDTDGGFAGIGFTNDLSGGGNDSQLEIDGDDGLRGLLVGVKANAGGTTDLVIRHRGLIAPSTYGATDQIITSNITSAGAGGAGVYQVIVKLQANAAPGASQGNDVITAWVNPADYGTEAGATASSTPITFNSFSMSGNDDLKQLTLAGIDYGKVLSVDEPRLGTAWVDVVPEPSALVLMGLGALAMMGRRRRGRA